ncbi:MAG: hypothetical protein DWG76_03955 [Chloroflexi bacterium]|nr:hypothetical protein [Chloroflexota bacterium]
MELMLESIFTPVDPRPAFLEDLRQNLVGMPGTLAAAGRSTLQLILMIIGGIVGLLLFIFGGFRAVLALITGIKGVGGKVKTRRQPKKKAPSA